MSIDTGKTADTDQWVRLDGEDTDASIDRFEVEAAQRALALLKNKLGRERLLDLLSDEIAAGSAYLREHVATSGGQEAIGTTTLRAPASPRRSSPAGWARPSGARMYCSRDTPSTTRSTPAAAG